MQTHIAFEGILKDDAIVRIIHEAYTSKICVEDVGLIFGALGDSKFSSSMIED